MRGLLTACGHSGRLGRSQVAEPLPYGHGSATPRAFAGLNRKRPLVGNGLGVAESASYRAVTVRERYDKAWFPVPCDYYRRLLTGGLLMCAMLLSGCAPQKPLKVLGEIPPFQLLDQSGGKFDSAALSGHIWVADFIYTTCQGPCPRMSSHMRALQQATGAQLKLVSFTVDPDNDTPAVLAAYAARFSAGSASWSFLTGDKETLNALDRDAFKLGTIGAGMDHSTRFVLVDQKGRIRGYYGIAEGNPVDRIVKDAARLEKEQI